jgi:predicted DNA-binding transcriptional regulator AlpA
MLSKNGSLEDLAFLTVANPDWSWGRGGSDLVECTRGRRLDLHDDRVLDVDQIVEATRRLALSPSTVRRMVADPSSGFPRPVKLPSGQYRHDPHAVTAWIEIRRGAA